MNTIRKGTVLVLFLTVLAGLPASFASADGGRFFVKSNSSFWQSTIGARNTFENGFTADLSDLQFGLLRLFRVEVEAVPTLHVLPADGIDQTATEAGPTATPVVTPTSSPKPSKVKTLKNKKGVIIRYLPSDQTPWGVETIYNDEDLAKTAGGDKIKLAILDTGVDTSHPDLKNRVVDCKDFTNFRFKVVDGQCEDKNGHGTHVAGIAAANGGTDHLGIYGVAPLASVMAYKVCGSDGSCYADDIATGIKTATDDGAEVINMSFGTDKDIPMIAEAVQYATDHGALLIAAAGNDGPYDDSIDYPAAYSNVVSVGAVNQSLKVTDWSSRGNNSATNPDTIDNQDIELAAPGENIESAWKGGSYAILSGTSMASPFVAGLAVKFWQINSENPAQATREFLHTLAHDLLPAGEDNDSGFGIPQIK